MTQGTHTGRGRIVQVSVGDVRIRSRVPLCRRVCGRGRTLSSTPTSPYGTLVAPSALLGNSTVSRLGVNSCRPSTGLVGGSDSPEVEVNLSDRVYVSINTKGLYKDTND